MRAGISETESAPDQDRFLGRTRDHRPGSRLEVERRQTRSSNLGFCDLARRNAVREQNRPMGLRAADECVVSVFWGKEFQFAYV
jgi:hypothetical protein